MSLSIFLGRFFGIYLLIIGIFYLVKQNKIRAFVQEFYSSTALILLTGVINVTLGLLIVIGHNVWTRSWEVWITILGYIILIKGLMRLFVADKREKKITLKMASHYNPAYLGIICLVVGLFFTYEGFF